MVNYWFFQGGARTVVFSVHDGGEAPNYLKIGVNLEHYKQNKKQLSILWSMYIFSIFWGK